MAKLRASIARYKVTTMRLSAPRQVGIVSAMRFLTGVRDVRQIDCNAQICFTVAGARPAIHNQIRLI